eukprot:1016471-Pelagomonas_calceolata.AAC.2
MLKLLLSIIEAGKINFSGAHRQLHAEQLLLVFTMRGGTVTQQHTATLRNGCSSSTAGTVISDTAPHSSTEQWLLIVNRCSVTATRSNGPANNTAGSQDHTMGVLQSYLPQQSLNEAGT